MEEIYAVVFMDPSTAMSGVKAHCKTCRCIAFGINMDGKKDVLGMYVGEKRERKFWLSIMNGLKNRGVKDILIACGGRAYGLPQAIEAGYQKQKFNSASSPDQEFLQKIRFLIKTSKS